MRRIVLLLIDLCLVAIATGCALLLRDNLVFSLDRLQHLLPYLSATLLAAALTLPAVGLNRAIWRFSSLSDYLRIVGASILIVLCALGIGFAINRLEGVPRAVPILQGILIIAALVSARVAMRLRRTKRDLTSKSAHLDPDSLATKETVLIVGMCSITELYLHSVAEFAADRIKVVGLLGRTKGQSGRLMRQYEVLGTADELDSVLQDLEVHGVFVNRIVVTTAFDKLSPDAQHALLNVERSSTIRVDWFAEHIGLREAGQREPTALNAHSRPADDDHLMPISVDLAPSLKRAYWPVKRAFDIIAALCLIIVLAPIMALVAVIVAIDVGLPVVFWQQRPGLRGRPVKLFKFRTMGAAHDNHGHRVNDEQRLSAVGHFLRRSRLDELPQLFNILSGSMSFVGPRPLLPVDQGREHRCRLLARPGLTGWAQVNGGRNLTPDDKSALDIWYVNNASLRFDLKILWLTFGTLIIGEKPNGNAVRQARADLGIANSPAAVDLGVPDKAIAGRAVA